MPERQVAGPGGGESASVEGFPPPIRRLTINGAAPFVETRKPPGIERMAFQGVWLGYGEQWVVEDVTMPVRQGEVLALIGASGSGKTTLLRSLNRLTEITPGAIKHGRITLDGQDVGELEVTELRRRVGMVFQQPEPFPKMSIFDNIAYALSDEDSGGFSWSPLTRARQRREAESGVIGALEAAGLYDEVKDSLDRPAGALSGGQQQRLCIARALAANPEVLLLDEPCSALDPGSTAKIEYLITDLSKDMAIVIVTHNLQQARRVAGRVAFMDQGRLIEDRPKEEIFQRPHHPRTREYIQGAFG